MSNKLKQYFGPLSPQWKFIVPPSPWWKQLLRYVKSSLKKIIGANCLTRKELETTIIEVEACINSRLLTILEYFVDASNPLIPSHVLIGCGAGFQPEVCVDSNLYVSAADLDLSAREVVRQA